jgi:molybdenum cofactor synthesis domain-containing protein
VSSAPEPGGRTAPDGDPTQAALARFLPAFPQGPRAIEQVGLDHAVDRVTANDVTASIDSPPYARSIVEGYLVNPEETRGAAQTGPVTFSIAGAIHPGDPAPTVLPPQSVWEVFTGSAIPSGKWGVIRQWDATRTGSRVACAAPIEDGANIEVQGCDLSRGAVVVAKGTLLGPDHIALIAAQGLDTVPVAARPVVGIFASGNEVIPHTARLTPGAIWDCNTPALSAFVQREGGIPKPYGIVRDDFDAFVRAVVSALPHCGMAVIAGGTAVGGREFVRDLVASLGSPGVLVNGVPMRSGKPLIMGVVGETPIVCVAGHPPEALRGFRLFGVPALARLLGRTA